MSDIRLKILIPSGIVLDEEVESVRAEGSSGHYGLLPRHIDIISDLVPGILSYRLPDGEERYVAVDEGLLLKKGADVTVSTFNAVAGKDLGHLQQTVEEEFEQLDEHERKSRSVLAMLEGAIIRKVTDHTEFNRE